MKRAFEAPLTPSDKSTADSIAEDSGLQMEACSPLTHVRIADVYDSYCSFPQHGELRRDITNMR